MFFVFLIIMFLLMGILPVQAESLASPLLTGPTFTVNSTLDQPDDLTIPGTCHTSANTCTLRAAVMQANRTSGIGATIMLPSGLYKLTIPAAGVDGEANGDLNLTTPGSGSPVITILGADAATTIIDANQLDRVFHIHANRVAAISDITIRNGYLAGASGGGIYNEGSLTVNRAAISANHIGFGYGGGIYNEGSLTLMNSTLTQNSTDSFGGGAIENFGILDLYDSTLSQNMASRGGGAIENNGNIKISRSTINSNGSTDGGGIYTGIGNVYVINSTISQNYANTNGGGIFKYGETSGLVALYNTTIVDNDADHDRDQLGGIGGGVYAGTGARFIVVNTLIARNTILDSPIDDDCNGMLEVYGWNLFGEVTGCTFSGEGTAGLISLNTIGPLQSNGGPTWTHALLPGSQAINNTNDSLGCVDETGMKLTTDQRGVPRVAGVRCDVGAYEYTRYKLFLPLLMR